MQIGIRVRANGITAKSEKEFDQVRSLSIMKAMRMQLARW